MRIAEGHRIKVYQGAVIVAILGIVGMAQMQTTGNLTTDIHEDDPLVTQMRSSMIKRL